jgi:hypothetical protein
VKDRISRSSIAAGAFGSWTAWSSPARWPAHCLAREDRRAAFFEIDAYLLYAHAAYAFRSDRVVLDRAAVAVRRRLGVDASGA